jgi:hypothetical protein
MGTTRPAEADRVKRLFKTPWVIPKYARTCVDNALYVPLHYFCTAQRNRVTENALTHHDDEEELKISPEPIIKRVSNISALDKNVVADRDLSYSDLTFGREI